MYIVFTTGLTSRLNRKHHLKLNFRHLKWIIEPRFAENVTTYKSMGKLHFKASSVDKAGTIVPHDWVESLQTKARVSSDFDG